MTTIQRQSRGCFVSFLPGSVHSFGCHPLRRCLRRVCLSSLVCCLRHCSFAAAPLPVLCSRIRTPSPPSPPPPSSRRCRCLRGSPPSPPLSSRSHRCLSGLLPSSFVSPLSPSFGSPPLSFQRCLRRFITGVVVHAVLNGLPPSSFVSPFSPSFGSPPSSFHHWRRPPCRAPSSSAVSAAGFSTVSTFTRRDVFVSASSAAPALVRVAVSPAASFCRGSCRCGIHFGHTFGSVG